MERGTIPNLTALRGLAALWVLFLHARYGVQADPYGALAPLLSGGFLGVPIFFVLSGFILAHVHGQDFHTISRTSVKRFLRLRLARIYPVHVVMLVIVVLVLAPAGIWETTASDTWFTVFLNLALVHAWGFVQSVTWNHPSWSISTEFFAYLTFPLFAYALRAARLRHYIALSAVALAAPPLLLPPPDGFIYGVSLFGFLALFVLGFALQGISRHIQPHDAWGWAGFVGVAALIGLAYQRQLMVVMPAICAVIVLAFARAPSVLDWRPLVWLGDISYSLYMSHIACFVVLRYALGGMQPLYIELVASVAVAALLHTVVEAPMRHGLRVPRQARSHHSLQSKTRPLTLPSRST